MSEFFHRFSWVDLVILILLIRTAYAGGTAGLAAELFKAAGLFVGLVASFRYYGMLAALARRWVGPSMEVYLQIAFFLAILIAAAFAFRLLRTMTGSVAKVTFVIQLEKYGGVAVGIGRGLVIASLLLFAAALIPNEVFRQSVQSGGVMGPHVAKIAPGAYEGLAKLMPGLVPSGRAAAPGERGTVPLSKGDSPR